MGVRCHGRVQESLRSGILGSRRVTRSGPCANQPPSPFASGAFGREAISSAKPRVLLRFRPQEQNKIASGLLGAQALAKRHLILRSPTIPFRERRIWPRSDLPGRASTYFPSSARRSKTRSLRDLFGAQALAKRTYPFASGAFGREAISSAKPRVLPLFRPQEQNKIASGLLGAQALAKRHLISRDVAGPGLVPGSNPLGHPLHRLLRRGASSQ